MNERETHFRERLGRAHASIKAEAIVGDFESFEQYLQPFSTIRTAARFVPL